MEAAPLLAMTLVSGYLIGSIPCAYIIVRLATEEDITAHGSGNVGAMNVRRSTGSWGWFAVAVIADAMKGLVPTAVAKFLALSASGGVVALGPWGLVLAGSDGSWWQQATSWLPMAALASAVVGHNYSVWMALVKRHFSRTGKGLATGGGALLAYDWRYFVIALAVALVVIAVTRYMMAGQVAAAFSLPIASLALRSPDWPFALAMGLIVYSAHHRRFIGLLKGEEPRLYIDDGMGPRG